jgi:hypothetical protein
MRSLLPFIIPLGFFFSGYFNLERETKNLLRPLGHVLHELKVSIKDVVARPKHHFHYVKADTLREISVARGQLQNTELAAALPDRSALDQWIKVYYPPTGRVVRCRVRDIGPWFVRDSYWKGRRRPLAEASQTTVRGHPISYRSGISLTPQVWYKLGIHRELAFSKGFKGVVGWRFFR